MEKEPVGTTQVRAVEQPQKAEEKTDPAGQKRVKTGASSVRRKTGSSKTTGRQGGARTGKNRRTESQRQVQRRSGASGNKKSRTGRNGHNTKQPIVDSFRHAFDGIFTGVTERNMKIHCTMAVLVVVFGILLRISVTEWCLCFILFGLIMGLELVNTSIEAVVDLVTQEYRPLAKKAKDTAAGAVLIAAIMAAVTGLIIFVPRLLYVLRGLF